MAYCSLGEFEDIFRRLWVLMISVYSPNLAKEIRLLRFLNWERDLKIQGDPFLMRLLNFEERGLSWTSKGVIRKQFWVPKGRRKSPTSNSFFLLSLKSPKLPLAVSIGVSVGLHAKSHANCGKACELRHFKSNVKVVTATCRWSLVMCSYKFPLTLRVIEDSPQIQPSA